MLRFRAILTSFLLLLIFGVNENAWAGVQASEEVAEATSQKESKSKSSEEEKNEKFTDWDFFGAFSLVNIQLQWRDHYNGLITEPTQTESSVGQKDVSFETVATDYFNHQAQAPILSNAPVANIFLPVSSYRIANEILQFSCKQNVQVEQIIAFIQNCGTYLEC